MPFGRLLCALISFKGNETRKLLNLRIKRLEETMKILRNNKTKRRITLSKMKQGVVIKLIYEVLSLIL